MGEHIRIPIPAPHTGTISFWRSAAPSFGVRTWKSAMDRYAIQHGAATAIMADDSAYCVIRCGTTSSGVFRNRYPSVSVTWTKPNN